MNNTEIQTATASMIYDLHNEAQAAAQSGRASIQQALDAAIRCGQELAQIGNGKRLAWLRDNVPAITPELCKAYLGIAATHAKRQAHNIDHRQLLMLGIIDQQATGETDWRDQKDPAKPQWLAWAGKLCGFVNTTTKQRPIEQWTADEREVVRLQLEPIARFYEQLKQ